MTRSRPPAIQPLRLAVLVVAAAVPLGLHAHADSEVDTFVVRAHPTSATMSLKLPEELLGKADVGERFCRALHCVVLATSPARIAALRDLEARRVIELEPVPDAHLVFLRSSTYDSRAKSFSVDFPGRTDIGPAGDMSQFIVIFKAFPDEAWVKAIQDTGMTPLESLQTMAYHFYGPRDAANRLSDRFSFVYSVLEVPAGLKRVNLDSRADGDTDDPGVTSVLVVAAARDVVLRALESAHDRPPVRSYRTGTLEAYSTVLSRNNAIILSQLPEVVSISRVTAPPLPSDERSNRIIAGAFQTPRTSWPTSLPPNTSTPRYWDGYLTQLSGLGLNLDNQVIGFLDTGADSGLQRNYSSYCPPYLRPPNYPTSPCKLVFTTDLTATTAETAANDLYYHGTFSTGLAAGYGSAWSSGRDSGGVEYSFTQGVAPGVRVAMCQYFNRCNATYRGVGEAAPAFTDFQYEQRLRYALVELGSTVALPDGGIGPGADLINHSWNLQNLNYEEATHLLDATTRSLSVASFAFDGGVAFSGPDAPVLHVVSAGNRSNDPTLSPDERVLVTAPAIGKNVLSVGSTETYNQQSYTPVCANSNLDNADNPHQIAGFSRYGFSNQRLKPDLVAPGTRAYGRRSVDWVPTCYRTTDCNMDLDGSQQYGWANGTSFSAPVVSGAAALTREWLRVLGVAAASPALVKAALISTAKSITSLPACSSGCTPCCSSCGDVRPAPDKYQGWGGISLDRFFRSSSNYFFDNQSTTFTNLTQSYTRYIWIANNAEDINIALVWTDRAGPDLANPDANLVNDLDLSATIGTNNWYGNNYYTTIDSCLRNGYSLKNPSPVTRDRRNNVERITIKASDIPVGATQILIQVNPFRLIGDGIDPSTDVTFRQDFALFVENAHQ